jgi:hypothetical protein
LKKSNERERSPTNAFSAVSIIAYFPIREKANLGKFSFTSIFQKRKIGSVVGSGAQFEQEIIRSLRDQKPFLQLLGVEAAQVAESDGLPFDIKFELRSGDARILVYGEIKPAFTPKQLADLKPWIQRLENVEKGAAFAVIAPALSIQAQNYCLENEINFLDLAGNISINVPGKFVLPARRDERPNPKKRRQDAAPRSECLLRALFAGRPRAPRKATDMDSH